MLHAIAAVGRDETGATALEYSLIAGLVPVAIITAVTAAGGDVAGLFDQVAAGFLASD